MKSLITASIIIFGFQTLSAQGKSEVYFSLADYRWENRVVIIFGPAESDTRFSEQKSLIYPKGEGIDDRDLKIVTVVYNDESKVDEHSITDESAKNLRDRFDISDDQFAILLIGKDGGEKLRSTDVIAPEDLFSVIDRMPMRQREMRDGK